MSPLRDLLVIVRNLDYLVYMTDNEGIEITTNEMEPALASLLQQGVAKGLAPEEGFVHSPN